jgi:hypothetical protein
MLSAKRTHPLSIGSGMLYVEGVLERTALTELGYKVGSAFAKASAVALCAMADKSARLAAVRSSGPIYVFTKRTQFSCRGKSHLSIRATVGYIIKNSVKSLGSFWKTNPIFGYLGVAVGFGCPEKTSGRVVGLRLENEPTGGGI